MLEIHGYKCAQYKNVRGDYAAKTAIAPSYQVCEVIQHGKPLARGPGMLTEAGLSRTLQQCAQNGAFESDPAFRCDGKSLRFVALKKFLLKYDLPE